MHKRVITHLKGQEGLSWDATSQLPTRFRYLGDCWISIQVTGRAAEGRRGCLDMDRRKLPGGSVCKRLASAIWGYQLSLENRCTNLLFKTNKIISDHPSDGYAGLLRASHK